MKNANKKFKNLTVPNFVSVALPIAELARGEKSRTQSLTQSLTHPTYLMCREQKLSVRTNDYTSK